MNCLVVAAGVKPNSQLIKKYAESSDLIIGVDKGCNYLFEESIKPNYIVGDFDSSNLDIINELINCGAKKHQYDCEKDFTDSEVAINLAISKKVSNVFFLGSTGRRFDHTLGNLGLLLKGLKKGINVEIIDDKNRIMLVDKSLSIKRDSEYKYISFLAYNETIENFNIIGAKYNLENYTLEVGDSRTVSNEFISDEMSIVFEKGNILIVYSKD